MFTWSPSAQKVCALFLPLGPLIPHGMHPWLQSVLLWMLPVEMWQEVLGCCPFDEYARLAGLRRVEYSLQWHSQPASREFYHLLKLSLLEMRFHAMLPSPSLGGLWLASRGEEARFIRNLRLGEWCSFSVSVLSLLRPHGAGCLLCACKRRRGCERVQAADGVHQRGGPALFPSGAAHGFSLSNATTLGGQGEEGGGACGWDPRQVCGDTCVKGIPLVRAAASHRPWCMVMTGLSPSDLCESLFEQGFA